MDCVGCDGRSRPARGERLVSVRDQSGILHRADEESDLIIGGRLFIFGRMYFVAIVQNCSCIFSESDYPLLLGKIV
jgi:hypothetical protein